MPIKALSRHKTCLRQIYSTVTLTGIFALYLHINKQSAGSTLPAPLLIMEEPIMQRNTIISLFDYTGNWSKPYRENGYKVIQIDIQHGTDILTWNYKEIPKDSVKGILAAVPCTDFALSGARHFKRKDQDGTTEQSIRLVEKTMEIIYYFCPDFWVIENPMSRIHKCCPQIGKIQYKFNPCDFAGYLEATEQDKERYNKTTWLWGHFNNPTKKRIEPIERDCPFWKYIGGKSIKIKNKRSATPKGFAQAFYIANQ